jgi:glycosyltransferase involved in cell wall biosynthesis
VYYFSYVDEEAELPPNCYLVKNPGYHRWEYAFLLSFVQRQYVRECDVLRVMQMYGALPAIIAKLLYRTPFVGTYGYRYQVNARSRGMRLRANLLELRAWLGLKLATKVIVTTEKLGAYVGNFVPASRIALIPNGVDTTVFHPADIRPERTERVVVYVGRLSREKNLLMLIDAVAQIQDSLTRLLLVGEGELRGELEQYAATRGISCEFKGIVPNAQLPDVLNNADVFVLPSLREGHPKVLLEAMSCGLLCVGTDVPGIREVLQDGETGLLSGLSADSLAEKLALVLADRRMAGRMARNARRMIEDHFALDTLLAQEIKILGSCGQ